MSVASSSRHLPTPYPTPPPTASLPLLSSNQSITPKYNAAHDLVAQHQLLLPATVQAGDDVQDVEELVSFKQAQLLARASIRRLACPWRRCDAVLASVNHLQRHVQIHVREHASVHGGNNDNSDSDDPLAPEVTESTVRCSWDRCSFMFSNLGGLAKHVNMDHVPKLIHNFCPHKSCVTRPPSDNIGVHALRDHPGGGHWPKSDLAAPTPIPFRPILALPPPLPTMAVPPYLLTARPVPSELSLPRSSVPSGMVSTASRPGLRTRPQSPSEASSSRRKVHPITPIRDPDDYWPMNGEADIQLSHYWPSSSFFPRVTPIDRNEVEKKWFDIQTTGTWASGAPITARKRTVLVDRPPIWPGADVLMRKRRLEQGDEKSEKRKRVRELSGDDKGKGKADAIDIDETEQDTNNGTTSGRAQTYSTDRVTRASVLRARRVTGRSVGIAAIEEMIAFEQRGVELGELPPDYSFNK